MVGGTLNLVRTWFFAQYIESFVLITQAVVEKTNFKANKGEKLRAEEKKIK